MAKTFLVPFAFQGDRTVTPDPIQPDGSVSYSLGFGPDYELENTNPAYKPVPRDGTNGIFFDITEALGAVQTQGFASFDLAARPYVINSYVRHIDKVWRSAIANNNSTPGANTDWVEDSVSAPPASTTVEGISRFATIVEALAGLLNNVGITPQALAAFIPKRTFTQNDFIRIPDVPGGLIIQWGLQTSNGSGVASFSFPTPFPNFVGPIVTTILSNSFSTYSVNRVSSTSVGAVFNTTTNNAPTPTAAFTYIAIGN